MLAVAITGLALAGPAAPAVAVTSPSPSPSPSGPAVPELDWKVCAHAARFECATAIVPLDYRHPRGKTTSLALTRLPATDQAHKIGSLFVNPGGPGGSGVDFVQAAARFYYSGKLRARFDIVGFDPRFIGRSEPLATCATDDELVTIFDGAQGIPLTRAQERVLHNANAAYSQLCAERATFLAHDSTANVGPRPRPAPAGGRRQQAHLRRLLVRQHARADLRGPVPRQGAVSDH